MNQIYFKDWIFIQRADVERFGKRPLPADVQKIYLRQVDDFDPNKVSYLMYMERLIEGKKRPVAVGEISATKRYLSPYCQKQDGSIERVKGFFLDRRVEIRRAPDGQPRYGEYGLTKAMIYAFMKEMANQRIEQVSVNISGDNVPSLKLSESLVGTDGRMEVMNPEMMPNGKPKLIGTDVYLQILNVREAIQKMEQRFPIKTAVVQQVLARKERM